MKSEMAFTLYLTTQMATYGMQLGLLEIIPKDRGLATVIACEATRIDAQTVFAAHV